jgi:predicted nucleic acid-binding protein
MVEAAILDANVLAKLVVQEHDSEIARRVFDVEELIFYAPSHALAEVFEVVCRQTKDNHERLQQLRQALLWLPGSVVIVPIETLLEKAVELALEFKASIYDSLYVALSVEREIPLVTADEKLAKKFASSRSAERIILLANASHWIEATFPDSGVE